LIPRITGAPRLGAQSKLGALRLAPMTSGWRHLGFLACCLQTADFLRCARLHSSGIGGSSGNETQIRTAWFAREVAARKIRYVLVDSTSGTGISDGRIGATEVMAWSRETAPG
jgi:hypothetical protein